MIFKAKKGQTSYGEAIGILMLDTTTPFIQGDVGNATTFQFPVRYRRVDGLTPKKIFDHDMDALQGMIEGARELEKEGVKAITGDCGFMAIYQEQVKQAVKIPVFLSSLLQIPFIKATLPGDAKIGIVTANARALNKKVFEGIGLELDESLVISGLEDSPCFYQAAIEEIGELDKDGIEQEMIELTLSMIEKHPEIRSILLECSLLAPYASKIQSLTHLPVYDFPEMINYIYSAVVKKKYQDII